MNEAQIQGFRRVIAAERGLKKSRDLYILAPGLGEDVVIDGVPIYGTIAERIIDCPPGSYLVMTREQWARNIDELAPLLTSIWLDEFSSPSQSSSDSDGNIS